MLLHLFASDQNNELSEPDGSGYGRECGTTGAGTCSPVPRRIATRGNSSDTWRTLKGSPCTAFPPESTFSVMILLIEKEIRNKEGTFSLIFSYFCFLLAAFRPCHLVRMLRLFKRHFRLTEGFRGWSTWAHNPRIPCRLGVTAQYLNKWEV
jgi:hypothetical protein